MTKEIEGFAAGWCIHYKSPMRFRRCGGGYSLDKFRPSNRSPCFSTSFDPLPCPKRRLPTADEVTAYNNRQEEVTGPLFKAFALAEHLKAGWEETKQGQQGTYDCPKCGKAKSLVVAVESSKGHSRGRCRTKNCLSWIE